jgi:primosomal protein N' (replication factor Y)
VQPQRVSGGYCSVVLVDPALSHLDHVFTYAIADEGPVDVGSLVRVPFRRKRRLGIVVALLDQADIERPLPIAGTVGPGISPEAVELARWVSRRYLATLGETLSTILPGRIASEEDAAGARAFTQGPPPQVELDLDLDGYPKADQLAGALQSGGGGFVWRPAATSSRAATIVAMAATAAEHGGVLMLVPEVRVSSDVVSAAREAFGDSLASLGSDRSARERYRDWLALRSGSKRIAIGGRASVFAPVSDLRLILVDDEGHQSYKEARAPRYHARTVAAERARRTGATLVLVGVPPSIEARAATERSPYVLIAPSRSQERAERPAVTVVEQGPLVPAARTLQMAKKELAMRRRVVLMTHRGGSEADAIVERALRILAPTKPSRLDATSTPSDVARAVRSSDCICATPFIAKDLMVPGVGLLALLEVDAALAQPEYRAVEDAFAAWWRAVRWTSEGHIVVETAEPSHPAIVSLIRWDPDVLYRAEAARRRELGYPPFAALARIDVPAERAAGVAAECATAGIEVLGPVEKEGHTVVVARARRRDHLVAALEPLVSRWRTNDEPMRVDIDPWEVMVPKWRS